MKPPPNTCPQIDKISVGLDAVSGDLETFQSDYIEYRKTLDKTDVAEIVQQTIDGLQNLRAEFEKLRAANEALRECGKFWYKKATNQ